jgi:hypothetical protein
MRNVVIDGVVYTAETELQKEERLLLCELYGALWTEAFYDPYNDSTQRFAEPLSRKMTRLNELMGFKK